MSTKVPWTQRAALAWDPRTVGDAPSVAGGDCYWKTQDWHSTLLSSDNGDGANLLGVTYQDLFSTAALAVAELRSILLEEGASPAQNDGTDANGGVSVVVAIPEGPWLPLAVLVVHALNRPFVDSEVDSSKEQARAPFAILVPLEPSEARERNRNILMDIKPRLVLAVPGNDMDHLTQLVHNCTHSTKHDNFNESTEFDNNESDRVFPCRLLDFATMVETALNLTKDLDSLNEFWTQNSNMLIGETSTPSIQDLVADAAGFLAKSSESALLPETDASNAAESRISHVVYTSGTTGRPKGCVSSLRSLEHYLRAKNEAHAIDQTSIVLLASALSFDPCLSDILATLQAGATLALAPRRELLGGLSRILSCLRVSHVLCTPTLWGMVNSDPAELPCLRVVALGGEPIPLLLTQRWARRPPSFGADVSELEGNCRLFATYGVTEACVYQTAGEICLPSTTNDEQPPHVAVAGQYVGKPFRGLEVRICEEAVQGELKDVRKGESGEIVLSGAQLDSWTRYWKRPELANKFVVEFSNDKGTTKYHYRTGDRGILDPQNGGLRIMGRIAGEEGMVKVNGVRVELGEIEAAIVDDITGLRRDLATPPIVIEGCIAKIVGGFSDSTIERREIHTYCVLSDLALKELGLPDKKTLPVSGSLVTSGVLLNLLRGRCSKKLKAACMPTVFIVLPHLPLSPTGKRDRTALPGLTKCAPLQREGEDRGVPLQAYGPLGKLLYDTICECLNLQPLQQKMLTANVTFDMIGGDSLAATRIIRALYAHHYQVQNNRFLGGEYGKFEGPFDVLRLLRAKNLGEYLDMLEQNKVGINISNRCAIAKEDVDLTHESRSAQELELCQPLLKESTSMDTNATTPPEGSSLQQVMYDSLLESATLGRSAIALALLHAGTDPNFGNHGKRLGKVSGGFFHRKLAFHSSPLHLACIKGDAALVQHLVAEGANCKSPDASGLFPLHLAASSMDGLESSPEEDSRRLNCVRYLLELGDTPLAMRDGNHQTVLHAAARSGHFSILQYAMKRWKEQGKEAANLKPAKRYVNWLDRWYRTPVHWAILNGRMEALRTVLEEGCSPMPYKPKAGKHTSVAMEYPMELCERLYPEDSADEMKRQKGDEIRRLLQEAIDKEGGQR